MERHTQEYTPEFRAEAVKVVLMQGLSLAEAAKRLSVPKGTLANWVTGAKASKGVAAPGARTAAELEAELKQVRKALAEARMERDIRVCQVFCVSSFHFTLASGLRTGWQTDSVPHSSGRGA
jgi:transposase